MKLIEEILSHQNVAEALNRVIKNKGASGVDGMSVLEVKAYFNEHFYKEIKPSILSKKYRPQPVRRIYIPKPNGKKRPLGIPTVVDRVIQQAISQVLMEIYEPVFSDFSYGFRPSRDCHTAINKVLEYLDEGYEWVVDLDIEKYFDTVNHDKLISILREKVNDSQTLSLIRAFLKAGIMGNGLVASTTIGVPQGGPLSPVLSNIYLDKFDKELENRGLHFVRYADDCNIFVKSEKSANRVMSSVTDWLERKLFLKVSATKTKVVRPTKSNFLGFTFLKNSEIEGWKPKPSDDRVKKLYEKIKKVLSRRHAVARTLGETFTKVNQIVIGWINYFRIGKMRVKMKIFGEWLRHKIRCIILKQWKNIKTIYRNLTKINKTFKLGFDEESIYKVANSRRGWYAKSNGDVINFMISPKLLATPNKKKGRPGLVLPFEYYLNSLC